MKRKPTFLASLALGTALAVAPALAAGGVETGPSKSTQDLGGSNTTMPNTGAGAGSSTSSGTTVERGTNKETGSGSAMMSASEIKKLKTADVSHVKVVNSAEMAASDRSTAGTAPADTTATEQQEIQAALQANPQIMEQLRSQSVKVSQIVAANYDGNGTVTVYTR